MLAKEKSTSDIKYMRKERTGEISNNTNSLDPRYL